MRNPGLPRASRIGAGKFRAVTGWCARCLLMARSCVDGKLGRDTWTCIVYADVFERKDGESGLIKITASWVVRLPRLGLMLKLL